MILPKMQKMRMPMKMSANTYQQKTLGKSVHLEGVGLHSGEPTQLRIHPAPVDTGIVFVRSDLEVPTRVLAHYSNVVSTQLATTLGRGEAKVSTVEHVLSALFGCDIDNAIIEVNGPEIPILDGSAHIFYTALLQAGTRAQDETRRVVALKKRIEVRMGERSAIVEPSDYFEIHAAIDWSHPVIGKQEFSFNSGYMDFSEVSRARTFGFLHEVESLKKMGLARGGSLDNAVVLSQEGILNPDGLRSPDEFVRHKVLDAIGDFMLAGFRIQGAFTLTRSGHDIHYRLMEALFDNAANYEVLDLGELAESPVQLGYAVV